MVEEVGETEGGPPAGLPPPAAPRALARSGGIEAKEGRGGSGSNGGRLPAAAAGAPVRQTAQGRVEGGTTRAGQCRDGAPPAAPNGGRSTAGVGRGVNKKVAKLKKTLGL